jgi:dynactin 1
MVDLLLMVCFLFFMRIVASSISPWIQRASDMKAEVMVNQDLEQKLQQHNGEIIRLIKDVKLKVCPLQNVQI